MGLQQTDLFYLREQSADKYTKHKRIKLKYPIRLHWAVFPSGRGSTDINNGVKFDGQVNVGS
jgi:hypothetical protein